MEELRQAVLDAIEAGVEYVLAYVRDERTGGSAPGVVRTAEQAAGVIFDRRCRQNLATLLPKAAAEKGAATEPARRIGLVAKACDVRSLIVLLQEEMIDRRAVYIIGMVCPGVDGADGSPAPRCEACLENAPALVDALVGKAEDRVRRNDDFAQVAAFEEKSPPDRLAYWSAEFARCRRCYACRQACPLCYCEQCLIERERPRLVEESVKPSSNLAFHLMRAYHLAGRCVDCGACQDACPEHLPLRLLQRKTAREVKAMFGHEAGMDPEARPPLVTLCKDDPDSILKGGAAGE